MLVGVAAMVGSWVLVGVAAVVGSWVLVGVTAVVGVAAVIGVAVVGMAVVVVGSEPTGSGLSSLRETRKYALTASPTLLAPLSFICFRKPRSEKWATISL